MNKIISLLCACLLAVSAIAKDYQAVAFGVKSDGITNNTRSIQHAIDYISAQGGGKLIFYVGRYLTGSIELKSGVTLVIQEGAVLLASPSIYDQKGDPRLALVYAKDQHDIAITGKGIIDGNRADLIADFNEQKTKGYVEAATKEPTLISLSHCNNAEVSSITLQNSLCTPLLLDRCNNIQLNAVTLGLSDVPTQLYEAQGCSGLTAKNCLTQPRY